MPRDMCFCVLPTDPVLVFLFLITPDRISVHTTRSTLDGFVSPFRFVVPSTASPTAASARLILAPAAGCPHLSAANYKSFSLFHKMKWFSGDVSASLQLKNVKEKGCRPADHRRGVKTFYQVQLHPLFCLLDVTSPEV